MLFNIINIISKKLKLVSNSYSKKILKEKSDKIIKKIFEEMIEIFIIFKNYEFNKNCKNKYFLIKEIVDIFYYLILLLIYNNIKFIQIKKELIRRMILSGTKEKQLRNLN